MKKKAIVIIIIGAIAAAFVGGFIVGKNYTAKKTVIDANGIIAKLEKCNDLASARYDYNGLIKYEDGKYTFLTKTGFSMIYDAYIKAGVDLSQADVSVKGRKVVVVLPNSTVMDVVVDEDSLEFYDKKFALLNWRDENDTKEALKAAREDAEEKAKADGILELADKHVAELVEGLLMPVAGDQYEVEVRIESK